MNTSNRKDGFTSRPADAERWVKAPETASAPPAAAEPFSARLTIDVTRQLRARIKIAAFRRGVTVADLLRGLLSETFPAEDADAS